MHVESDHKPLEIIVKKPLATAQRRLQKILMRMQKYDYRLEYKPGRELVLPDILSWAPCCPETTDINNMEQEIALHVHLIQSSLPVSKPKLEEIREEITKDESLKDLSEIIKHGWPETKACLWKSTCIFWDVRDELTELKSVILRGGRFFYPTSMRKEMLERIHQGHMGIEKSKQRA